MRLEEKHSGFDQCNVGDIVLVGKYHSVRWIAVTHLQADIHTSFYRCKDLTQLTQLKVVLYMNPTTSRISLTKKFYFVLSSVSLQSKIKTLMFSNFLIQEASATLIDVFLLRP